MAANPASSRNSDRAEDRPGFLLVVATGHPTAAHVAGFQVQHMQHGLLAHALDEGQRLAIGRRLRAHRAARRLPPGLDLTGLAVQSADGVDQSCGFLLYWKVGPPLTSSLK
jgi:hypothetical protein